jgi:DNA-binding response OmpR family regulator
LGNEWQSQGAQSFLVKPVNTAELLRQIEALLISHQDHKMRTASANARKISNPNSSKKRRPAAARKKAR